MKIEYSEIREAIEIAAIEKKEKELIQKGYSVQKNYDLNGCCIDLYANKNNERIIYEFKNRKTPISKKAYEKLQKLAKENDAKFKIIYVVPPTISGQIQFDELENILLEDIRKKEKLTREASIVTDVVIDIIAIDRNRISITGGAYVEVKANEITYGFKYSLKLNAALKVQKSQYRFLSNA